MTNRTPSTPILYTKLHRPAMTAGLVNRPQLLMELEKGCQQRSLTLVSAPAGYGKSTLLSCWLEEYNHPGAWVSLDNGENDLRLFVMYILAAAESCFSGFGNETRPLLNSATLPPLPIVSKSLINDLNQIAERFILVLDDYHLIENKEVHELIAEILHHPPRLLHLVLAFRHDPPLPLARLRGQNQITDIRIPQLQFTAEETAAFLHKNISIPIDESVVSRLGEKTEGWVTGLRLATLFLRQQTDIDLLLKNLSKSTLHITDYLHTEILNQQKSEIQNFLLKTSILNRLCGPLCDVVIAPDKPTRSNGQACLVWLVKQNLFTISLDEDRVWYRYHHLFQQVLQLELKKKLGESGLAALHSRASTWFAENKFIDEAIDHALTAGDISTAVQLFEQNRHTFMNADNWFMQEKWLAEFPENIIRKRPKLMLSRVSISYFKFTLKALPLILETTETLARKEKMDQAFMGELHFYWGILRFWEGQAEFALDHLQKAVEWIPEENSHAKYSAESYLAYTLQMNGQEVQAIKRINQKLYCERTLENVPFTRYLAGLIGVHMISGNLTKANLPIQQLLAIGKKNNNKHTLAWASFWLASVHFQQKNLREAIHHFQFTVENRYALLSRAAMDSLCGLALSYQAINRTDKVKETVDLLMEFAISTRSSENINLANSIRARLSLFRGDVASAVLQIQAIDPTFDAGIMLFWIELPQMTRCRVMVASRTGAGLDAAIEFLQVQWQIAKKAHNKGDMIEILILKALAYKKQMRFEESLTVLRQAVILARPGGWIRPFLETGPEIAELLRKVDDDEVDMSYVRQLLDAFANESLGITGNSPEENKIKSNPSCAQTSDLTNREIDILIMLSQRLRNQEIADRLFIAPATVKRHAVNIYQKLGVTNRRHAVQKAVALDIIPLP